MQTYKLLEEDSVLLSQPVLIEHFGRAGAQFLNQLHYWLQHNDNLGRIDNGIRWIYNSAQKWAEQLRMGPRQIQRIIKKLEDIGVLQVQKLSDNKYNRTNHYTIDYDRLEKHLEGKNTLKPPENSIATLCRNAPRQNVVIYRQKLPYKDFNKSEGLKSEGEGDSQGNEKANQVERVEHVHNFNLRKIEKDLGCQSPKTQACEPPPKHDVSTQPASTLQKKPTTTQDMLAMWNETLGSKAEASMSRELAPLLVSAFAKKFDKNLEKWKQYCEMLRTSSYLMGEQFQLSIFWSLKFGTIDRIMAGELGVKRDYLGTQGQGGQHSKFEEDNIKKMIEELLETDLAKQTRHQIAGAIGYRAYHSWFHQAKFIDRDKEIRLEAPNAFVESIWDRDYPWVRRGK
jgi:hypothetical protein